MKGRKFEKKLKLKKFTVANLPRFDMKRVFAGNVVCSDDCSGVCFGSFEFPDCKLIIDFSTTS